MKIAVPASAPDLDARVEFRLGTTPYLLVIDTDDMSFETVAWPARSNAPGTGVHALSLALDMGARTILSGYVSPNIAGPLRQNGIEVVTGVSGSVRNAIVKYGRGDFTDKADAHGYSPQRIPAASSDWKDALQKTLQQFYVIIPVLSSVFLLTGLIKAFLPGALLPSVFSGNVITDTFSGACLGSILGGNPINSYVIGETMLKIGVSPFGVTALMLSWVSVWLIQIPIEMSALGTRFAVIRIVTAFLITIPASIIIVVLSGGIP